MRKPTPNDLLRQLYAMKKMFKNPTFKPAKKTELQRLEERQNPGLFNLTTEVEHICAILPELIASVKRNKDIDRAAYFVGMWNGICLCAVDTTDKQELSETSPANAARLQSNKSKAIH